MAIELAPSADEPRGIGPNRVTCVATRGMANNRSTWKSSHRLRTMAAVSGALLALGIGWVPSGAFAQDTTPTPGVLPPWANPHGRSYSQWSAALWQWELEQPNDPNSPVVVPGPGTPNQPEAVNCALGQSGRVWFLVGRTFLQSYVVAYRSCTIPSGVSLFFPVIDAYGDDLNCPGQPPFPLTGDQLAQAMAQQTESIIPGSMSVTVDGRSVQGLTDSSTAYRATAAGFSYTLPDNNALSGLCPEPIPAGTTPPPPGAYADGVYIMLTPLSPGTHTIHFEGTASGGPLGDWAQDDTYTITVAP